MKIPALCLALLVLLPSLATASSAIRHVYIQAKQNGTPVFDFMGPMIEFELGAFNQVTLGGRSLGDLRYMKAYTGEKRQITTSIKHTGSVDIWGKDATCGAFEQSLRQVEYNQPILVTTPQDCEVQIIFR